MHHEACSSSGPAPRGPGRRGVEAAVDPEVEALCGLPLDEFIKARDVLAKARSKEQGKEAGAAVKGLRKASVVAWALNQLARQHPDDVEALLEAGARLRRAQTAALEGGDPAELREATRAENREAQALAPPAGSILRGAGRGGSATQEERLAATLRAAAVDTEAADWLRRGVLTEELSPAGFGFGVGDAPATHVGREERDRAREQERSERERRRELEQELRAARETAARMEREADKAEERAREARAAANDAAARAAALAAEGGPK